MTGYNELKAAGQILVVEDDPVQRRLLKNAIERSGHVVHQAFRKSIPIFEPML